MATGWADFFGSDDGFSLMKLRDVGEGLKKFNEHLAGSGHKKAPGKGGSWAMLIRF